MEWLRSLPVRASKTGELYNEVPDRFSDAAVFIGAGFAWGGNITLGYIATILSIFTAYVRAAGKIAGAPNEFCGRWQNNIGRFPAYAGQCV